MPRFDNPSMDTHPMPGSTYAFSAARPTDLGASEYTLVALAADRSSSVSGFAADIERCVAEVVRSCGASPRSDNLMLRFTTFNHRVEEVHGYRPLITCSPDDYRGSIRASGSTALCDASFTAVQSLCTYGAQLEGHDFDVNGIVFVITDGAENASSTKPAQIKKAIAAARASAQLSSLVTVLVGVGVGSASLGTMLEGFRKEAGFDRYVELEKADAATLASLADFVSKSIAVQSKALATGTQPTIGF
ncbi:MAG: hypothetical protein ACE37F_17930 [Nannocystaceae bacterium]|nr:hypothetical protein [bacterium]